MWIFSVSIFFAVLTTIQSQGTGCNDASNACTQTLTTDPQACSDSLFKTFCCKSCQVTTTTTSTTTTTTPTTTTTVPTTTTPRVTSQPRLNTIGCPEQTSQMPICGLGPTICSDELLKQMCCITCATTPPTTSPTTTMKTTTTAATTTTASQPTICRKKDSFAICDRVNLSDRQLCSDRLLGSACCDSQSCSAAETTSPMTTTTVRASVRGTTTLFPGQIPGQRNLCPKRGRRLSRRCRSFQRRGVDICALSLRCCEPCTVIDACKDTDKKTCKDVKAPDCYIPGVRDRCCAKCKKFEKNREGCMYGDRLNNCKRLGKILGENSLCDRYSSRCCETCRKILDKRRGRTRRIGSNRGRSRITRIFQGLPDGQTVRRMPGSFRDLFSALTG